MTVSDISTADLKTLANSVPKYPVSVKNLIGIASKKQLRPEVIQFYRGFPENVTFDDKEDIVTTGENVSLLQKQYAPDEDAVHGAED